MAAVGRKERYQTDECPDAALDTPLAIEAHKAAWAEERGVKRRYSRGRPTVKYQAAMMREKTALLALLDTMPTTPRGVAAALGYMGYDLAADNPPHRTLLHDLHIRHSHEAEIATVDTYLLRLGEALAAMLATA